MNGQPAVFMLDTGADISAMPYPDAQRLGVKMVASNAFKSEGIGGRVGTGEAQFNMTLGKIELPHEAMTVLPMASLDHHAVAVIGRELLAQHDLELDMPDNAVRLVKVDGCAASQIAYWNKPYSQVALESDGSSRPAILVNILLNGHVVPALIDSGAPQSIVTPAAARAAGVDLDKAQMSGEVGGIGVHRLPANVVRFDTFTIGDETIRNAEIVVSDMWKYNKMEETGTRLGSHTHDLAEPRMLLGADFLHAHRVLVANSLKVMVFSYAGGPIFDSSQPQTPAPGSANAPTR
ncbi:retropepsin-like aspartic protease [Caulobacter sp. S45]|uniref:retropepsin-like aspartic protease n=1 Tax=Caulobacter sp. S45 TaxID=1641861 RepID=UPI00131CCE65|nr:retropepsin-like aspartic protease [Caulobacter sp. S45]